MGAQTNPGRVGESRLPVYAVVLVGAMLHLSVPAEVAPGPSWVPVAAMVPLLGSQAAVGVGRRRRTARRMGQLTMAALTFFLVGALATLLQRLLTGMAGHMEATMILRAALPLWVGNVLVFGLWYWRLDAGGPHVRERGHRLRAGLRFPESSILEADGFRWRPALGDYLYLAFTVSTSFSSGGTSVVAPWAKGLAAIQTLVSLSLLVVVAARAVNIL